VEALIWRGHGFFSLFIADKKTGAPLASTCGAGREGSRAVPEFLCPC